MLAGGRARRLGGLGKARVPLAGRPMIDWPLAALADAGFERPAVIAKADSPLPALPDGVRTWIEPGEPRHPLTGILEGLRRAGGAALLVCAVDLPLVEPATIRALAQVSADGAAAVVARGERDGRRDGEIQPLLARYEHSALPVLESAASNARMLDIVAALAPRVRGVPSAQLLNVNDPDDLARAELAMRRRGHGVSRT